MTQTATDEVQKHNYDTCFYLMQPSNDFMQEKVNQLKCLNIPFLSGAYDQQMVIVLQLK